MQYGSLSIGLALAACSGVSGWREKNSWREPVLVQRLSAAAFCSRPRHICSIFSTTKRRCWLPEGRYEDLPVFCTEEMARMLEERLEHDHELLPGLWRVYRLEGVWEEDVVEVRPGEWRMRRPAQLIALSAS